MKRYLAVVFLVLTGCHGFESGHGIDKLLNGSEEKPPQTTNTLTTVACCDPISSHNAAFCQDLLHGAGVHGVPPNLEHYIIADGRFYIPLRAGCDTAEIK